MKLNEFVEMPRDAVAALVRERGKLNVVFWTNGTRRWFLSNLFKEQGLGDTTKLGGEYAQRVAERTAWTLALLYEHGITSVLWPAVYYSNLLRGDEYTDNYLLPLIELLCYTPVYRRVLKQQKVRFHCYGEMEEQLNPAQRDRFQKAVGSMAEETRDNGDKQLFVGFCPADAASAALRVTQKMTAAGKPLAEITRDDLVRAYYGDHIDRVHLTIAHGRLSYHSTPFLTPGDLYFQISPSLYLDEFGLRRILYDFIFCRPIDDWHYEGVPEAQWSDVAAYYEQNRHQIVGLGRRSLDGKIWSIEGADAAVPEVQARLFGSEF